MSSFRRVTCYLWVFLTILVTQPISSIKESSFLLSEEDSMTDGDVRLQSRVHRHHLSKRQSPFDIPIVNALMWTIGLLAFILPFRLYRINPVASMANRRKDVVTPSPFNVTESPMTESAILAHRIVKAVEDGGAVCANYTICSMADEVKKMGSRKEITISIAEKFLPDSLLPTIDVLRKAILFPKVDEFCQQFECSESQIAVNSVSSNNNNDNNQDSSGPDKDYDSSSNNNNDNNNNNNNDNDNNNNDNNNNDNNNNNQNDGNNEIQSNNNNNEIETVTLQDKSTQDKAPFPMVEPTDSLEEQDVNTTNVQEHEVIPEWKVV